MYGFSLHWRSGMFSSMINFLSNIHQITGLPLQNSHEESSWFASWCVWDSSLGTQTLPFTRVPDWGSHAPNSTRQWVRYFSAQRFASVTTEPVTSYGVVVKCGCVWAFLGWGYHLSWLAKNARRGQWRPRLQGCCFCCKARDNLLDYNQTPHSSQTRFLSFNVPGTNPWLDTITAWTPTHTHTHSHTEAGMKASSITAFKVYKIHKSARRVLPGTRGSPWGVWCRKL